MNEKIKLLILFGGTSSEHEISRKSTASVLRNLDKSKYEIYCVGITKEGKWILTEAPTEKIEDGSWEKKVGNKEVSISPSREVHGIRYLRGKEVRIDCAFPILHGKYGEDGTVQGILEIAGIPYVGSGVLASAACMDKAVTKIIAKDAGILQAGYHETNLNRFSSDPTEEIKEIDRKFKGKFPLFVKPANAGSSVGVSKVHNEGELAGGLEAAFAEDKKAIIEEAIIGRELEVAVLGNNSPQASPVGEIISAGEFYDYKSKYEDVKSETRIPDDLPEKAVEELRATAVKVFRIMGCRGFARVDFFYSDKGEVIFNEINTIPGFTAISMYPKLWEAAGLSYRELIDKLIELALERE